MRQGEVVFVYPAAGGRWKRGGGRNRTILMKSQKIFIVGLAGGCWERGLGSRGGDRQQGNSRSIERNRGMVGAWEEQGQRSGVE